MINNKAKVQEETADPMFNSGIAYLERIDQLLRFLHTGIMQNNRVSDMTRILDSLFIEIFPRLKIEEAETLKQTINNVHQNPIYPNLIKAAESISLMAHKHKLIMPDKQSIDSAFEEMFKR